MISLVALTCAVALAFGSGDSDEFTMTVDDDLKLDGVEITAPAAPAAPVAATPAPDANAAPAAPAAPVAAPAPAAEAEPAAPAATGGKASGTVSKHSGSTVVVDVSGTAPPKGATVQLTKQVNQKLFGADVTATLNIGKAVVDSVSGSKVTLSITEEQSTIVVDGKKTDHFSKGAAISLEW